MVKNVLVVGGVTYDTIIQTDKFPLPVPQTLFSKESYKMIGGTGSGKALNLSKLGFNTTLHAQFGDDNEGLEIKKYFKNHNINLT